MKKILSLVFLLFILFGCENPSTVPTEPTEPTTPTIEPLEPYESCEVPYLDQVWVCTWADEFNGDAVDESKWTFQDGGYGGGNQEVQYYTRDNTVVEDGKLKITAKVESMGGKNYTSSRLHSQYKANFKYQRILVSAKMPSGRGTWPAIWMMPTMSVYGGWPRSGEIDIMEYAGYQKDVIHSTIHTRKFNHNLGTQLGYESIFEGAETSFKVYELIWKPGELITYVDGTQLGIFRYVPGFNQEVPYHYAFPFDQEFFMILNLAIGGTFGGVEGIDQSAFPTTMEIDYVRVYTQDYNIYDEERPTTPTNIQNTRNTTAGPRLPYTIFWNASQDDMGVERYNIFVDDVFHGSANLNQFTFKDLVIGESYSVQIQAVDFTGKTSNLSDSFTYTHN